MTNDLSLIKLKEMMVGHGVIRLYFKRLAPNNNSKQQVYLGGGFSAINFLPIEEPRTEKSSRRAMFKAGMKLSWMDETGDAYPAPNTTLILYPQYPEVRMSGFLIRCKKAPSKLMQKRRDKASEATEEYQRRVMFLGVTQQGTVIGYVAAGGSQIENEVSSIRLSDTGILQEINLTESDKVSSRKLLLTKLREIHEKGWIRSYRLKSDGSRCSCEAFNCGGYTLEAELGITPNGFSEPDYLGWEVKQYGVGKFERPRAARVTLMTPEPTGGFYKDKGVEPFVRKFGYLDTKGRPDRMNFGGIHRVGTKCERTGLVLTLEGFDPKNCKITDPSGGITLLTRDGDCAAKWDYSGLMKHWNRKHAFAVYIPSMNRKVSNREYRYGSNVHLGEGTDFTLFLSAMACGNVFYDPGIKLVDASSSKPKLKRRSQFRMNSRELNCLYHDFESVSLVKK